MTSPAPTPITCVPLAQLLERTERIIAQYVAGNGSAYYIRAYTEIADDLRVQIANAGAADQPTLAVLCTGQAARPAKPRTARAVATQA